MENNSMEKEVKPRKENVWLKFVKDVLFNVMIYMLFICNKNKYLVINNYR